MVARWRVRPLLLPFLFWLEFKAAMRKIIYFADYPALRPGLSIVHPVAIGAVL